MRYLWFDFLSDSHAIVFMVDGADDQRLDEAHWELSELLNDVSLPSARAHGCPYPFFSVLKFGSAWSKYSWERVPRPFRSRKVVNVYSVERHWLLPSPRRHTHAPSLSIGTACLSRPPASSHHLKLLICMPPSGSNRLVFTVCRWLSCTTRAICPPPSRRRSFEEW